MPPLFNDNQQLDESELVNSFANKAPRSHKAMLISQGFNPETGFLATFLEHCERPETTDNISIANFSASDKDSDIKKHKNRSKKFKERVYKGKERRKKNSSLYCSLHGKKIVTSQGIANSSRQGIPIWKKSLQEEVQGT